MMQAWFTQLSPRERTLVLACGAFILLAVIWTAGLRPLLNSGAQLNERVSTKQTQLANLQELASQINPGQTGRATPLPGTNESIVVIIDRTTRERQLSGYLKRNQPEGVGVRIRFEGAPFDPLVGWLADLRQTYGMSIVSASFDEASTGRVNCSLELRRAGS